MGLATGIPIRCITVIFLLPAGPSLRHITVAYLFDYELIHFHTKLGWMTLAAHLLNGLCGAVYMMWIVSNHVCCAVGDVLSWMGPKHNRAGMEGNTSWYSLHTHQYLTSKLVFFRHAVRCQDLATHKQCMPRAPQQAYLLACMVVMQVTSHYGFCLQVERAKKVLDFASTCYVFHLIICCSYGGWPKNLAW